MFNHHLSAEDFSPQNPNFADNLQNLYEFRLRAFGAIIDKAADMIRVEHNVDRDSMTDTGVALMILEELSETLQDN